MRWFEKSDASRRAAVVRDRDDREDIVVLDPDDAEGFRSPTDKPCEFNPAEPRALNPLCARDPEEEDEEDEDLDYLYEEEEDDVDEDLDEDLDDEFDDEELDEDLEEEDDEF